MLFQIITMILMLLSWKATRSLTITSIISIIWCYTIPPLGFWLGSWVSWGVMWELSALDFISTTTEQCSRKNGGTMEMWPNRLGYKDWLIHHGCVGRAEGYSHPIYGNLVLVALPFAMIVFIQFVKVVIRYIPCLNRFYLQLQTIFSVLAGIYSFLSELFVVTKPVELGKGVLVDTNTYNQLVHEKCQMEKTILDYMAKLSNLEHIVDLCAIYHAEPDATIRKAQQNQLATSQQQLDRLRREYVDLQNHCQRLEDRNDDVRHTDVRALRLKIELRESEILALKHTIKALEARPDAQNLKAEKKRAEELQQKLNAHIQEATAAEIQAGLKNEEMERLRISNKSLLSESKAAEMRAQVAASTHKKAMEAMKKKTEELEAAIAGLQHQLEQARDEANIANAAKTTNIAKAETEMLQQELEAKREQHQEQLDQATTAASTIKAADATIERLQQELEVIKAHHREQMDQATNFTNAANAKTETLLQELKATKTQYREQFGQEVNSMKAQFQGQFEEQFQAAQQELANAAETEVSTRVKERVTTEIQVAREELTKAAEIEINARVLTARQELDAAAERNFNARMKAARKELADASEAKIKARVDERLLSAINEALALRDVAEATYGDISFDDGDEFANEFNIIAAECQQLEDARQAEACRQAEAARQAEASRQAEANGANNADSTNSPVRKRATGRIIPKIPGIGKQYHPQHVVAHAEAQAAAASMAAFEAGKFFGDEHPDINKPFEGERKRVESSDIDDGDEVEQNKRKRGEDSDIDDNDNDEMFKRVCAMETRY